MNSQNTLKSTSNQGKTNVGHARYARLGWMGLVLLGAACNSTPDTSDVVFESKPDASTKDGSSGQDAGSFSNVDSSFNTGDDASVTGDEPSDTSDAGDDSNNESTDAPADSPTTDLDAGASDIPTNCTQANATVGCCDPEGVVYYCTSGGILRHEVCAATSVCGWNAAKGYYGCVSVDGGAGDAGSNPMLCTGNGSPDAGPVDSGTTHVDAGIDSGSHVDAGVDAGSHVDAGVDSGATVTWTEIYDQIFGPSGTSTCSGNGCHSSSQSGFACGSTATSCYNGMVSAGLVTPGSSASSSELVSDSSSPLCGSLGGRMPKGGTCITDEQLTMIQEWLAAGAADN